MLNQLARVYAQAVYELALAGNMLDEVQRQLEYVTATIAAQPELRAFMNHPLIPPKAKKETLTKIFDGELADFVNNFLLLLIDKRRETALPAITAQYIRFANQARNIAVAEVVTARPLTDAQQQALTARLSQLTGSTISLKISLDPQILGGVIVKIGEKLLDASLVRQLQVLQSALLSEKQAAI